MDDLGKIGRFARRTLAWLSRSKKDDELREEIQHHIDARERQLIDDGMDPRDAAFEARRQFGNATVIRDETRDMRSFRWLDTLVQDIRFGARVFLRTPMFSAIAVLSLALGIGASVAMFNVADAVLFRPLPVRDPSALRSFRVDVRFGANVKTVTGVPDTAVPAIQSNGDFADFIGIRTSDDVSLGVDRSAANRLTRVEFVTANYFDVLGVAPSTGRLLEAIDERSSPIAVVISDRLWNSLEGGGNPIGRTLSLNGEPAVIVGTIRRFAGVNAERPADVFAPLPSQRSIDPPRSNFVVQLLGRLHRGVSVAEAEQKLANLYRVAMPGPTGGADLQSTLQDASRGISGAREALERPLRLGLTLVAVLVLVACMNTGGLLLSRFVSRQGEFGIRVAIGAGRARLARQLLVEALVIAAAAAAIALFAGWLGAPLFMRIVPETGSQVAFDLRFDLRLVLFTISLAVLCAAGAAAASLFRLWRSDPAALLSTEGRTVITGSRRVTRTLIAAQVACSLLLVVGAVSMARTLVNLHRVPLGFDPEQMFVINVNATGLAAPSEMSAYHARLSERIAAAPGVARATMAQIGVLTSSATIGTVTVAGFTPGSDDDRISRMFFVGRDYFGTMGMRIIAGRDFDGRDEGPRSTVSVVNEQFANFYFGSPQNAVDRFVNKDVRVVGVVTNAHYNTPRDQPSRAMFLRHVPMNRPSMAHIVRIGGDPSATMRAVTEAIVAHDSRLRPRAASVTELLATSLARERFFAVVAWLLSSLALVLACGGLYAAVAYAVLQRQGEIAVRIALGASAANVLSLVLRDPLTTTALGIAAGIPGAYLLMRSASSLLFGVSTFDVTTVALCGVALVLCGLLAAIWPARRALSIDPVIALRNS